MTVLWELVALGLDAAVVTLCYQLYRSSRYHADMVQAAPQMEVGPSVEKVLTDSAENALPYVCIEGNTKPVHHTLRSQYTEEVGLIRRLLLVDHRTKRIQGYWSVVKEVIKDNTETVPFMLVGDKANDNNVQVTEPLSADHLMDDLRVTHDEFTEASSSVLVRGIDRLFGDVPKGLQEKEEMLSVGIHFLGVGRLVKIGDRIKLVPPIGDQRYVLTTLSRFELLKVLQRRSTFYKVLTMVFGAVGLGLLMYWAYKKYAKWKEDRDNRSLLEEFQRHRERASPNASDSPEQDCVVCLSKPREVVLLNCGHICTCFDCLEALPIPKLCPVCRGSVVRAVPVYLS